MGHDLRPALLPQVSSTSAMVARSSDLPPMRRRQRAGLELEGFRSRRRLPPEIADTALQGARLRLSRLLVYAVDGTGAAARVARAASADDLPPRDRWIRGGGSRAPGGDDPYG